MLILPIVNRNPIADKKRIMNVAITLKNAKKVKPDIFYNYENESNIIVNGEKFSNSIFKDSRDDNAPTDFIRAKSILYPRNFTVTTKTRIDSKNYDIYEVSQPPRKVNTCLDKLYGKAITDLRKKIPGIQNRGRYVSFEKLGMDEYLTDEKIEKLQRVVREERDQSKWPEIFEREGISDITNTLDFINNFEFTVVSDTTIPEESLQDTLKALGTINTRDYKNLNNYYKMAKRNADIYKKISKINRIMYDEPLALIQSERQKQLVKQQHEVEKPKEKILLTGLIGDLDDRKVA